MKYYGPRSLKKTHPKYQPDHSIGKPFTLKRSLDGLERWHIGTRQKYKVKMEDTTNNEGRDET